jgi:hypothetical protein
LLSNQLVCALLLLVSLLTACNGTTDNGNTEVGMQNNTPPTSKASVPTTKADNPTPVTGDTVRVARWAKGPNWGSFTAHLVGTLDVVNNCLVIRMEGSPPMLPIFPYDYGVWDGAKQTFTYEGKVIRIGETIDTGGGTIQLSFLKEAGVKYDIPDCGINEFWLAP